MFHVPPTLTLKNSKFFERIVGHIDKLCLPLTVPLNYNMHSEYVAKTLLPTLFASINLLTNMSNHTHINPLTPNDLYSGRTAPLTSKRYILYIYSTNTGTEYFKNC